MNQTLPHSSEIESRMLGALISIGTSSDFRVRSSILALTPSCFYVLWHRDLFELIEKLYNLDADFTIVGMLSVIPEHLRDDLHDLLDAQYYSPNLIENDLELLIQYRQLREHAALLYSAYDAAMHATIPGEALSEISRIIGRLSQSQAEVRKTLGETYAEIAEEYLNSQDSDISEITVDIPGLPPIPNQSLITIAGRSGHGKTMIAIYLMDKLGITLPEKQILYFNLEMQKTVMVERHGRIIGGTGSTRKEVITSVLAELVTRNVTLISVPMISIDEIELECNLASLRQPISVVVVDYLGLISSRTRAERKDLEQANIAKRLAALALNLNCVVIALIQVNRDYKNREVGQRCPMPSDASESMGSVHSAGWWIGIDQPQVDSTEREFKDLFQVRCRKNRFDSGLFKLDLDFIDGQFFQRNRKFGVDVFAIIPE
jgi:replicative DNA helicase